ncbi:MAG: hypothetical protein AUH92_01400 [Acidobacteria bacterium 13_1_40CM_4_69_4]|nr:MAG: hypothetical protein AUH92_01400 [Acidobacteria bacterium 13_1_40CM_4_69_4]
MICRFERTQLSCVASTTSGRSKPARMSSASYAFGSRTWFSGCSIRLNESAQGSHRMSARSRRPPGLRTRRASRRNRLRGWKWKAASTQITVSKAPSGKSSRVASMRRNVTPGALARAVSRFFSEMSMAVTLSAG